MAMIDKVQRTLSIAQCVPVVGPLIVSPCKSVVSAAQIIAGLAKGVFCGIIALSTAAWTYMGLDLGFVAVRSSQEMLKGYMDVFNGMASLIYSGANMFTFGVAGLVCEATCFHFKYEIWA